MLHRQGWANSKIQEIFRMVVRFLICCQFFFGLAGVVNATTVISPDEYALLVRQKTQLFEEMDMSLSLAVAMEGYDLDEDQESITMHKNTLGHLRREADSLEHKHQSLEKKIADKNYILGNPKRLNTHIINSRYSCLNPYRASTVVADLKRELETLQKQQKALREQLSTRLELCRSQKRKIKSLKAKISQRRERIKILKTLRNMILNSLRDLRTRKIKTHSTDPDWVMGQLKPDPLMSLLGSLVYQKDPIFDPGEDFRSFYVQYSEAVRHINEVMDRRISHLESVQKLVSPVHYQHEFLQKLISVFGSDEKSINKIMDFYRRLALQLHWFKVASASIASGEVNGDESMLFGGRELALAALEGAEGLTDEIPLVKSAVRLLALGGMAYIHKKQLEDNQQYSFASSSFLNSEVFCYAEAGEIMAHIDLMSLAARDGLDDLCEPLAVMWKKSVMSCEKHQSLSAISFTGEQASLHGFLEELRQYRDRYLGLVGKRFAEKMTKNSLSRKIFRWRNSLNGLIHTGEVGETVFEEDTESPRL